MATYISLCNFTDQGIRSIKDTTKRADAVKEAAQNLGKDAPTLLDTGQFDLLRSSKLRTMHRLQHSISHCCWRQCPNANHAGILQDEMTGILAKMA